MPAFSVSWANAVNASDYLLEISKDDAFIPANSVYSCTFPSGITRYIVPEGAVLPSKWYYWRITALNSYGRTVASNAPFSFATGLKSSGTPSAGAFDLTEPLNIPVGEVFSSSPNTEILTPDLNWTNAPNEVFYEVYLDNDSNFNIPLYTTTAKPGVLNITIPDTVPLTETSRYYWKVVATNPYGNADSSTYSFATGPIKYYTLTTDVTTITADQGLTATLTAYGNNNAVVSVYNPFSITMNSGAGINYYTSNTFSEINTARTYTLNNGVATIYAKVTLSGSTILVATDPASRTKISNFITVNPGAVAAVTVFGPDPIASAGTPQTYTAVSKDANGNTVSETYTWAHANGSGSVTRTGNSLTGFLAGTATITATGTTSGISGDKVVTITAGAIVTVTVSGSDTVSETAQVYTAVSRDINGNTVSDTYNWTHLNDTGSVTRIINSLIGNLAGTVTITATSVAAPSRSGGKVVTVVPGAIATVTVSGANSVTSAGTPQTYAAVSKDANGNTVSETYTWTHANGSGSVTRTGNTITGFLAGTATITATGTTSGVSGGKTVTVTPGTVTTVTVSGANSITSAGTAEAYTAVSRDANNNTVSDTYNWAHVNDTGSVTRTGNTITGFLAGNIMITATSVSAPGVSGGKVVTVVPGTIATVTVTGSNTVSETAQAYTAVS
ncbi:MAG: hypothetical protein HZA49_04110, partial [Planctomycetes bacterium]|nr:hypothetical protein [Planctomycetota bacterium]